MSLVYTVRSSDGGARTRNLACPYDHVGRFPQTTPFTPFFEPSSGARLANLVDEKLLGSEPAFFLNEIATVWEVAEHGYVYLKESPGRAGHALHLIFVDDLDERVAGMAGRGVEPSEVRVLDNGVRKVIYRDPTATSLASAGHEGVTPTLMSGRQTRPARPLRRGPA